MCLACRPEHLVILSDISCANSTSQSRRSSLLQLTSSTIAYPSRLAATATQRSITSNCSIRAACHTPGTSSAIKAASQPARRLILDSNAVGARSAALVVHANGCTVGHSDRAAPAFRQTAEKVTSKQIVHVARRVEHAKVSAERGMVETTRVSRDHAEIFKGHKVWQQLLAWVEAHLAESSRLVVRIRRSRESHGTRRLCRHHAAV